ncbi:hypothetical protein DRN75_00630 [Nanoarchaeota archaeon]|nr:MAG: hypothetical protein DRN75_00630 [Nanoarchaeota archaeon]
MINPSQLKKLAKMLNTKEMDVKKVIFAMRDGSRKVIDNPSVSSVDLMGQRMYQVIGDLKDEVSDEDIQLVMEKSGCDEETARKALLEAKGDIARAILIVRG